MMGRMCGGRWRWGAVVKVKVSVMRGVVVWCVRGRGSSWWHAWIHGDHGPILLTVLSSELRNGEFSSLVL